MGSEFMLALAATTAAMETDPSLAALMRGELGSEAAVAAELSDRNLNPRRRAALP